MGLFLSGQKYHNYLPLKILSTKVLQNGGQWQVLTG
jgi:hypothetical protein